MVSQVYPFSNGGQNLLPLNTIFVLILREFHLQHILIVFTLSETPPPTHTHTSCPFLRKDFPEADVLVLGLPQSSIPLFMTFLEP